MTRCLGVTLRSNNTKERVRSTADVEHRERKFEGVDKMRMMLFDNMVRRIMLYGKAVREV